MADSHTHLKITGEEWEAFLDDFQPVATDAKISASLATVAYLQARCQPPNFRLSWFLRKPS